MKRGANEIQLPYQPMQNYFWKDVGLSSDQETKKNGMGLCLTNLARNGTQHQMMRNVAESGHPAFRCPNQFSSDVLKSRGGEISSIHYNAGPKTAELLLKTIIAVNQLSVFGAVAKWCNNNSLDETVGSQDSSFFRNSRFEGLCLVRCDAEMS